MSNDWKDVELLPCPFCGSIAMLCNSWGTEDACPEPTTWYVECTNILCGISTEEDVWPAVTAQWNTRTKKEA